MFNTELTYYKYRRLTILDVDSLVIVALYSVLIVTNSQSLFLPLFIMTLRINFTILDSNLYL